MTRYKVILVMKDIKVTQFMQAADAFEDFKVIGMHTELTVDIDHPLTLKQTIELMRDQLATPERGIVAIFSPGQSEGAWKDDSVRVISDGKSWILLDDLLAKTNYVSEITQTESNAL